ncbi:hypothetical protein [Pseudarthrobacter sp. J47]|uniref:hypothetical protein n=1 Tax=Pseudarthrobacter sp. J47 TaxID=3116482 RepID=UPI002E848C88|nr:hypothetical protein [Pseudarthrobacter sp. J47]
MHLPPAQRTVWRLLRYFFQYQVQKRAESRLLILVLWILGLTRGRILVWWIPGLTRGRILVWWIPGLTLGRILVWWIPGQILGLTLVGRSLLPIRRARFLLSNHYLR